MTKIFSLILISLLVNQKYILAQEKNTKTPNIILIMADDMGYGDVGFNGNKEIITPNLDDMAKSGIKLNRFYAAAPLCSPTRASVLTGRYPFRQGIFAAHTAGIRHGEETIAELLKKAGYRTGFFGKWHLGWVQAEKTENRGYYSPPWQHGFQDVFATKSAVPTWNPTKAPKNWKGFGVGKDGSWDGSVYVETGGKEVKDNLDGDDSRIIMDRAIPFIEDAVKKNKPFFATIWFHAPHEPFVAGPTYLAKYPNLSEEQKNYYGCITALDDQVGRLRQFLKKKGLSENTIIFFCSDNGPSDGPARKGIASAGPFTGHKHQLWEGGLRVPSLIEWPGKIKGGQVSEFMSSTVDYLPTVLDLAGLTPKLKNQIDGISLKSVVFGDKTPRKVPLASGYQRIYKGVELFTLIDNQYKIVIPDKGKKMMLFDLKNDPKETKDIADLHPDLFQKYNLELEKIKASWLRSREGGDYIW